VTVPELATRPTPRPGAAIPGRREGLITYGAAQLVLLFWWVACYPGLFSTDSLDYIWQSTTGNWNTHHPVPYTAMVWLSLQLTGGVAALTLLQTIAMAVALAYAARWLSRIGLPWWLTGAAAVLVVALPPVGTFVVCVWKDVPYVIAHVLLLGTLARLVVTRTLPRSQVVLLGAELAAICLFRQNGFLVALIAAGAAAFLLRASWRRVAVAGGAAIALAFATNLALLPALGVRDGLSGVAMESFWGDLAIAYQKDPGSFPPEDLAAMSTVASLTFWRTSADCGIVDTTVWDPAFNRSAAVAHQSELLRAWFGVLRRSPGTIVGARVCRGAIAWNPLPTGGLRRNPWPWSAATYLQRDTTLIGNPNRAAVTSDPLSHRANQVATRLIHVSNQAWLESLLWRGATFAYVAYAVVGYAAWRRRDRTLLVLASLTLANQVSVFFFNNLQAARYMAAPYVLGVLLLPLLAVRPLDKQPEPAESMLAE
jgi:hypothetical protein